MTLPSPPSALGQTGAFYLGTPGAMQKLRMPDSGYSSNASRAEVVQTLLSGSTVVNRVIDFSRTWGLPFSGMTADVANVFEAFYTGALGPGPFALVDPAWRNVLTDYASSMGAKVTTVTGWALSVTSTQTLAYDTSVATPFVGSGIMRWAGAGSGSKVGVGTQWLASKLQPDATSAPLYLSDQGQGGALYARTASSTASLTLNVNGEDASGTVQLAGSSSTATVNSSGWTRLASFLASGNASARYTLPTVTCNTSSAPNILLCCADVQYNLNSVADLDPWVLGLGSPRVVISAGLPATIQLLPYRNQGLTLSEV